MIPPRDLLPIPLPNGRSEGTGYLSVHFTPRLGADGTLRDYPDWRRWPEIVSDPGLGLRVIVDTGQVPHTVVSPSPDPAVWNALFGEPGTTSVRVDRWRFVDRRQQPFPYAFDAARLTRSALALYAQTAVSHPETPPSAAGLASQPAAPAVFESGVLDDAAAFVRPLEPVETEPEAPDYDFHQTISLLRAHPELLRLLGLVVDLEITLPPNPPAWVAVRTRYPSLVPGAAREVRFRMATDGDFRPLSDPRPGRGEQLDGYLPVGQPGYSITSVDGLLGAQRLLAFSSTVRSGEADEAALPALRERGISLIRHDLRAVLAQRFARQREIEDDILAHLNNPAGFGPVGLFAEDATAGYRYDVRDEITQTWRSLFERQAPQGYSFPRAEDLELVPEPDEGWRGITLMTEAEAQRLDDHERVLDRTPQRVLDVLFRWTGWSAATRPPGRVLRGRPLEAVEQPQNEPGSASPAQVAVDYQPVPASLPRLRYGVTYDMRARCVDLAGNSRALAEVNPQGTEATETFGRLEPVAPPTAVRRSPRPVPGVGDTATTLVILSDYDTPDDQVVAIDRLFFPPRLSQYRVELHDLPDGGADPAAYEFLVERDAASLETQTVVDPATGELVAGEAGPRGAILPGPERPAAGYLVDPTVTGVAFEGMPQARGTVIARFGGAWPDPTAVRLQVAAGTGAPRVFGGDDDLSLTVYVPKACEPAVEVSCSLDPAFAEHFGLWNALSPGDREAIQRHVRDGRHWMFSGRSLITLVHAVRRPLAAPEITALEAGRPALGAITAVFRGSSNLDRKSTERLDLLARWTDPVDDPALPEPTQVTTRAVLARLPVAAEGDPRVEPFADLELDMHDTKRHEVRMVARAYTRFGRYFTEQSEVTFTSDTQTLHAAGVVGRSVVVTDGAGAAFSPGVDYEVDAAAGTLTRIGGGGIAAGATVTVRYVARPVSRDSLEGRGEPFEVLVPASAPPLPPQIDSVLPAFARQVRRRRGRVILTHDARVLRVYLRRPWYSSGDREALAVMIDPTPGDLPALTRWGRDPLVAGTAPGPAPALGHFARASWTRPHVDGAGHVAAHDVTFDASRDLWYADVRIRADVGYRPFVRLALARVQPDARAGAHLSAVIEADPMRLGPSRRVEVERQGAELAVTVTGLDRDNVVTATLQEADPGIVAQELGWTAAAGPVTLTRTALADRIEWTGRVTVPASAHPQRLLIEDSEPTTRDDGAGSPIDALDVVYVETIELPD